MKIFEEGKVSLKICGVRTEAAVEALAGMGVPVLGFNFWEKSRRYLHPEGAEWLKEWAGRVKRVGVFVNEGTDLAYRMFGEGWIDVVQLHGDEPVEEVGRYVSAGIPVIKAIGIGGVEDLATAGGYRADAILLDAYAPRVFGGTGEVFDWALARMFSKANPEMPMILAGGITVENAREAIRGTWPVALDVASGAEVSPGVKNFEKVGKLLEICAER